VRSLRAVAAAAVAAADTTAGRVEALESRLMLAAVTISGDIRVTGESDSFNFNFATPRRLYFDSLTNSAQLRWSLDGPPGTIVSNRPFNQSDSADITNPVIRVGAGSHNLTVDGVADFTGAYAFRLVDLANGTPLPIGTNLFDTLTPANETDVYTFNANAGDVFTFDNTGTTGIPNARWRLIDPYDNVIFNTSASTDVNNQGLPATGTYTLLIEGRVSDPGASGSYAFTASFQGNNPPNPFTGTALTLGATVSSTIAVGGEVDPYVFTLPAGGARVAFDALGDLPNFQWSLRGPGGLLVNNRNFQGSDSFDFANPQLALPAGTYRLDVAGINAAVTGAYSFRLLDFAAATVVTPGTPVSSTLNPATETDIYKFDIAASGRFFFDQTGGIANASWRLIDPFGNIKFSTNQSNDVDTTILSQPGTYFLVIEGRRNAGAGSASYTFNVQPVSVVNTALVLNSTASGNISVAGENDPYTFTLASPGKVAFDAISPDNSNFTWSLVGPGGFVFVGNRTFQNSDSFDFATPTINLPAGDYTLTIDPAGDTTGAYSFKLMSYAGATPITPGTPVNASLTPATETDVYSFSAGANSRFFFDSTTGISNASWRLIDPYDNILFSTNQSNDVDTQLLTQPGTYILIVEGRRNAGAAPAPYAFNVVPVTVASTALTLGSTTSGTISVPGESDQYTFTLASPGKVAFDVISPDSANFQWNLVGPGGATFVGNRSFQGSDSFDFTPPIINLPAGDYTLTIDGAGDAAGAYSFRLLNYSAATPLTPGTPVNSTLNPATETDIYSFSAGANSRFYFDSTTGITNATWRLIDPYNNVLFSTNQSNDVDTQLLAQPGTYFLVIEGRRNAGAGSVPYAFNVVPVTVASAPLTIGTTANGSISVPGESDQYTFTLASPAKLAFDVISPDNGNFTWTLVGPGGVTFVGNRGFQSSDSFDFTPPFMNLPAGDYTVTIDAAGEVTGAYAFRFLSYAAATAFTPGNVVNGALDPGTETDIYSFNVASPNSRFYFDVTTGVASASWRLVDPFDNVLFSTNLNTDVDTLTIAQPGTYFLVLEGRRSAGAAPLPYAFNVRPVTISSTAMTLGTTVNGDITVPGESDAYTFTLGGAGRFVFDAQTDNGALQWSLTGPGGSTIITNRNFQSSDSFDQADILLNLPAGPYTLTIDATADATGAYQFRLLDFASATAVTPGTPVSSTLNPGTETDLYKLTVVNAGDTFNFDSTSPGVNASWRLFDPFGNPIFSGTPSLATDQGPPPLILGATGDYTLVVEGRRNAGAGAQSYMFNVVPQGNNPPNPITGTALTLGSVTSGSIAVVGEQDSFQFTLAAPAKLYFDSLTNNTNMRWSLIGPGGSFVSQRPFNSSDSVDITDPQVVLPAGTFMLTISAVNSATGAYSFRLSDLASATTITPGTPVVGTLNPGNETDAYKFTATAGQKFYFDVTERTGAGNARWRLIDPNGNFVFNNVFFGDVSSDVDTTVLPLTGTYTLLLEGRFNDTGTATYTVNVQPVTDSTQALTIGGTVSSNLSTPGEQDNYTFTLASPATLYFDSLTNNSRIRWSLVGPGGALVNNRTFNQSDSVDISDPQLRLPAGAYTLTIDGVTDEASAYSFRLIDLASATTITPGTPFSGTLNPAIETDAYKFTATAGQKLYFDVTERTGAGNARWRLIDPNGNFVFNNFSFGDVNQDVDTLAMPLTGTYTLLLEGRFNDTGTATYTVNVRPVTDSSTPLVIGNTVNGNIGVAGEQDVYTFTLASPATLYFDSQTNSSVTRWSLLGPSGTIVTNRIFNQSDANQITDPQLPLPAGSYTLTVDATGENTPNYSFRLLDLAVGTTITPGTPFNGSFTPPNETDVLKFSATAGQKFFFDILARAGSANARWRLIDLNGNILFNSNFGDLSGDVDTLAVPLTGTYTLLLEGRFDDIGPSTYQANVVPVTDSNTPLTIGTVFNGVIATGETDNYTFTLAAPATLYFDTQTSANATLLRWNLFGPAGTIVSNRFFNGTDAAQIADPQLMLPAGNYTLAIDATGDNVPPYAFRLLDLAGAQTITPGTPVAGSLNPSNETDLFKFTTTAGSLFYFDDRARTGAPGARWRLIDPNGHLVFNNINFGDVNGDVDTLALPLTGTYTLLVEGRFDDPGTATYIFNVQPVADGTLPFVAAAGTFNVDLGPNHRLQFAFSQNVSASLSPADFQLINLGTGTPIPVASVSYDLENNVATAFLNTTLPEGNFRMTLLASGITDSLGRALDGDGDGQSGGNFQFDFFFLPGDTNYDRKVDFNDLVSMAQHYNSGGHTFTQGDFNYDGFVDFNDLVILAQHYNFMLPPAPGAPVAAGAVAAAAAAPTVQPASIATLLKTVSSIAAAKPATTFSDSRIRRDLLDAAAPPKRVVAAPKPAKAAPARRAPGR
jgi:hypothetical protein